MAEWEGKAGLFGVLFHRQTGKLGRAKGKVEVQYLPVRLQRNKGVRNKGVYTAALAHRSVK